MRNFLKIVIAIFIFINRRYVKQYPINMNSLFKLEEDSDNVIRNYLYYP